MLEKKKIAVLGSTGSIGQCTLRVATHLKEHVQVIAIASHSNIEVLERQIRAFHPQLVCVYKEGKASQLRRRFPSLTILSGMEGLEAVATKPDVDLLVSALVGAKGIQPALRAIEAGKSIALANKEALVAAGDLIMARAREKKTALIPIDSEHSAIFQCLNGTEKHEVRRIILTASGGPFHQVPEERLKTITPRDALKHPNWSMGEKVTVDASTLMNKGLEVIEAHHLFGIGLGEIDVVIHPQSLIHSFVEFVDGALLSQMGEHDMAIPIQYALTYPSRKKGIVACFDFRKYSKMEFCLPNHNRFPCLGLAYEAAKVGGSMPCFMNAANEVLVDRFLNRGMPWSDIGKKLEVLMERHRVLPVGNVETVLAVDEQAREQALII